jgi:hypothetical protein
MPPHRGMSRALRLDKKSKSERERSRGLIEGDRGETGMER